jgi:heat shock protein 1/8
MVAVGIDLGTTNSCVAVYTSNGVEIIANDAGDRTTPSYVLFLDNKPIVGKGAKTTNSKNTKQLVYDAKRMLGKKFTDTTLKKDLKDMKWPFIVKVDDEQRPRIHIDKFQDRSHQFLPEQISAYVLQKMKKVAEEFHLGPGKALESAVITVPAYFNDDQKQATKAAAEMAGLKVLRLLSEPSAAGLAFCYQRLKEELHHEHTILVYDLGGGTFDVSIMKIVNGQIEVKITDGDTHLGGNDFDANLIEFCTNKVHENISENKKALWKLRSACIVAKEYLSNADNDKYE